MSLTAIQKHTTHNESEKEKVSIDQLPEKPWAEIKTFSEAQTQRVFGDNDIPPDLRFRVFFSFLKNIEKKKKKCLEN